MRMSSASRGDKLVAQVRGYLSRPMILTAEREQSSKGRARAPPHGGKKRRASRELTAAVEISIVVLFLLYGCFSARATVRVACREISHEISSTRSQISGLDRGQNAYSLL